MQSVIRPISLSRPSRLTPAATLVAALLVALVLGAAALLAVQGVLRDRAADDAASILARTEGTVTGWLARHRALPSLYAEDPRVRATLTPDVTPAELIALGEVLKEWNDIAGTSDTYVMGPDGTTLAASNQFGEVSFVGRNFSFRPYFTEAIAGQSGRFFGLGTTSGLRGYYVSAPIRDGETILGVIAVKISPDVLEAALADAANPLFVTDDAGVVILSGLPELRLTALRPAPAEAQARVEETRRYDLGAIAPAPVATAGDWASLPTVTGPATTEGGRPRDYIRFDAPVPGESWQMHLLYDTAALRSQMRTALAAVIAALVAAGALAGLAMQRRRRLEDRLAERERARVELARKVEARTAELSASNRRLEAEVSERIAAEASLRQTQGELVQAGKLAALGQMSAALSHEFNQPLTAIRTYAENARAFYDAGRSERAEDNLRRILRLTERMAQLSKHLTRFARRSDGETGAVALDGVIAEALALLSGRITRRGAEVRVEGEGGLAVMGGAVRLQHVVMNLVGNAMEAVPEERVPQIAIRCAVEGERVTMVVEDNGEGIPEEVLPKVFDPFFTTKEVGSGLGLGLSICYNIVRDFGGEMRAEPRGAGGARFVVTLARAAEAPQVAAQ
ncbi:ATP-binding protein [Pseudoroseicyclus tamaricis]|uniref:C4-dicarboxylate transport sensor protein DctB n=1 Tax=Pseudoroseicyclus tamaricis TaxID=2705421 RepID=A0A6B2JFM3_9RHOB|nr:ATP-binding protein [Pseudoroseicyclus tamaricis]NDU99860.1 sensor histidine kinase [Pseudoroseicyclus tamaricis]